MRIEDLKCVLQHYWAYNQKTYTTERQKFQILLLLLLFAFTNSQSKAIFGE